MKAADPNAQYRPLCTTELKDGYIITLRRTPIGPPGNIEHADVSPFAVVTVSRAARLQLARRTPVANDTEASDKSVGPSGVLDSAAAIAAAQRVVPARQTLHCLIRLSGGAWVEFLRDDASAAKDRVGGAVVAVESATNARIIATF
jgi:hypothetical protein